MLTRFFPFFLFLGFLSIKNLQAQKKYHVALSGHYVSFGTWDIIGYGISSSFQKELVKNPKRGLNSLKVGGEVIIDIGSIGTESIYKNPTYSDARFATVSMSNVWFKASYYPFNKYIPGLNISLGPTIGYKSEIYGKLFQFTPIVGSDMYRKEILSFDTEKGFTFGYRISLGYDIRLIDNKIIIGLRSDFFNNNVGDINSSLGIGIGYRF